LENDRSDTDEAGQKKSKGVRKLKVECKGCGEAFDSKTGKAIFCLICRRIAAKAFNCSGNNKPSLRGRRLKVSNWVSAADGVSVRTNGDDIEVRFSYSECSAELRKLLKDKAKKVAGILNANLICFRERGLGAYEENQH